MPLLPYITAACWGLLSLADFPRRRGAGARMRPIYPMSGKAAVASNIVEGISRAERRVDEY